MITYLDTSAFLPLLIDEPASTFCRKLWDDSDAVATSRLLYVEAAAALAHGARLGRLTEAEHAATLRLQSELWQEFDVIDADEALVVRAAGLARQFALRGHDAVHVASAYQIIDHDLVVASGDRKLLEACAALGLATADTNGQP